MSQQPAYNPEMAPPAAGWVPPESKNFGEAPPPYPGNPPPAGAAYPPQQYTGAPYPPTQYSQTTTTAYMAAPMGTTTTVVMTGNCPRCHMGNLIEESNTGALCCIIILVILFFPIGLLYLLCLPGAVERRCPQCGYCSD